MLILPFDCIFIIFEFLPWSTRTKMVSRNWLYAGLRPMRRLKCWESRLRMYAYMRVFGTGFSNRTWVSFCQQLDIRRRKRNRYGRLSWQTAAHRYMATSCKRCGKRKHVKLCRICRHNLYNRVNKTSWSPRSTLTNTVAQ